ncbi:serine/threonine-protein kinase, partial [Pseudonocardia abyssalis]
MSPDPTQIAGYRLIRRIGRGGMSTVYLAEHVHLHRHVALKVLDPEFASNPTFRTRFARESQIVAELEHPHIVPVYDAGEADGLLFLVMRYVEQGDLRDLLAAGDPLHHDRLRVLVDQLAGALGVAHDAGLVHRDIKPANVLSATGARGGDHFYLSDFGITKRATSGPPLTATGQVLGSVDFIAPEQIAGRPLDRRTDVYAFGGLVYQCLTGHLPFERDHELAVLLAHVREDPLPPSTHRPELPPEVDAVLARVLSKDPDARPATARDFADELVAALNAKPGPAPRPVPGSTAAMVVPVTAETDAGAEEEPPAGGAPAAEEPAAGTPPAEGPAAGGPPSDTEPPTDTEP